MDKSFGTKVCPQCEVTKPADHNYCGQCGSKLLALSILIKVDLNRTDDYDIDAEMMKNPYS